MPRFFSKRLLDADDTETVNTSMRLPASLREAPRWRSPTWASQPRRRR